MALLQVDRLAIRFATDRGWARAVEEVSLEVGAGETLALVGESGCGKSVTALSILGLLQQPPAEVAGSVAFEGRELVGMPTRRLRRIRGKEIGMVFQEPMTSLNPVLTVGRQISEVLRLHLGMGRREAAARVMELLDLVGIPEPARRARAYPFELSGGMRQRIMIAIALACNPRLLIADEPTTALDVTTQAQILNLLRDLKRRISSAIVLITHDLGVVAEMADRVVIMYAGRVVEEGAVCSVLNRPRHPYTQGLLAAVPRLGSSRAGGQGRLFDIPGTVPDQMSRIEGCAFAPRCPIATDICRTARPPMVALARREGVACHHAGQRAAPIPVQG